MDPLSKTDSAISVASKDHGVHAQDGIHARASAQSQSQSQSQVQSQSQSHHERLGRTGDHDHPRDRSPDAIPPSQPPAPGLGADHRGTAQSPPIAAAVIHPQEMGAADQPTPLPQDPPEASSSSRAEKRPSTPPHSSLPATRDGSAGPAGPLDSPSAPGQDASDQVPVPDADPDLHTANDHDGYESEDQLDALAQSGTGAIIVDHDELESDPGYESDRASFTSTSLSSSVRDYLYENGRRYHRFREGRYNFPNDEAEQDREDMKHACVKMLCQQRLFFAPLAEDRLHNILDIGTGTGIWAIEMGDQFPSANVLGIDLSPIQPEWVPSNVHFCVDDAESEWVHPTNHFDYIHTRHTVMAIKDWPKLYRTAKEHLRPGGWIESQEIYHYPHSANDSMPPDHPVAHYWASITEGLNQLGIDFHAAAGGKIANLMREAGFVNVHERIFHVPLGTWPKHPDLKMVGEYWRHILLEGVQAIALGPLTRGCRWTREEVEVFLIEVRKAYFDNASLIYMPMYITCGQKPEYE